MKEQNNRQFVFYSDKIESKSTDENGIKRYFVKGYITTHDLDLVNDIVTHHCTEDIHSQFKSRNIKLDFDHEILRKAKGEDDLDMRLNLATGPLGKTNDYGIDDKGNFVEFELNPEWKKFDSKGNIVKTFDSIWSEIKAGFLDAFSIAYVPIKTMTKNINGTMARLLDKVNMINVALTGNPINPGASMMSAFTKSIDYLKEMEGDKMDEDLKAQVELMKKSLVDINKLVDDLKVAVSKKADSESEDEKKKKKEEDEKKEAEGKAFKEEIAKMQADQAQMKAFLEQPQIASLGVQKKSTTENASTFKGPLDLI